MTKVITSLSPLSWREIDESSFDLTREFYCQKTHKYYDRKFFNEVDVNVVSGDHWVSWRWMHRELQTWCHEATNDDLFFCEISHSWCDRSTCTIGSYGVLLVCNEYMYFNEDYMLCGENEWTLIEYDEDDDDNDRIPDYHQRSRHWNIPDGITFGVELETYCERYWDCYQARPESIIGERDGSLDDEYGVEYIGPPLLLSDYTREDSDWRKLLTTLKNHNARSYSAGRGYGMHVSVGRQSLPIEQQLKFILLINANQEFSEMVAGRRECDWAYYNLKDREEAESALRFGGGTKYSATNVEDGRIEVRIFRGTIAVEGFLKNIEYVASVLEYAGIAALEQLGVDDFLRWMADSAQRRSYPHFAAWLVRKNQLIKED